MILFDMIMKPADSYWKKRCHADEIQRRAAEVDRNYYKYQSEDQQEKLHVLSERDIGQYHAIEVLNQRIRELEQKLEAKDKELAAAQELLAAERRASKAWQMNEKLWSEIKGARA